MDNNNNKSIIWNNVKSKYILKKIFDNLEEVRALIIIRIICINKALQNKLDIDINAYKEMCKIIIDIYPKSRKEENCSINLKTLMNHIIIFILMRIKKKSKIIILVLVKGTKLIKSN